MKYLEGRLREARKNASLTQKQLSEKIGMSTRALIRHEKDSSAISLAMVLKIALACEVDEIWLLTGKGMMEKNNTPYTDSERCSILFARLRDLEHNNPQVFNMVETYITGVHEGAKAALASGDEKG